MDTDLEKLKEEIKAMIEKYGIEEVEEKMGIVVFGIKGRRMLHV